MPGDWPIRLRCVTVTSLLRITAEVLRLCIWRPLHREYHFLWIQCRLGHERCFTLHQVQAFRKRSKARSRGEVVVPIHCGSEGDALYVMPGNGLHKYSIIFMSFSRNNQIHCVFFGERPGLKMQCVTNGLTG
jgi:hypothetical protein